MICLAQKMLFTSFNSFWIVFFFNFKNHELDFVLSYKYKKKKWSEQQLDNKCLILVLWHRWIHLIKKYLLFIADTENNSILHYIWVSRNYKIASNTGIWYTSVPVLQSLNIRHALCCVFEKPQISFTAPKLSHFWYLIKDFF